MSAAAIRLTVSLLRKDPRLPVYVVIPGRSVAAWGLAGTTIIEGSANGVAFGRRTIKAMGKGSDDWFVEFTAPFCQKAKLSVGDVIELQLALADSSTPDEFARLFSKSKRLEAAWAALPDAERREASEHVRAGKARSTRERRAAQIADRLRAR